MMPAIPQIIECPRYGCEQKLVKRRLESGNTFGAVFWTDGRMDAPMMPEYPDFTRCPECGWFFWIHKAEELGPYIPRKRVSKKDPSIVEDYPNYPEVREPTFKQYLQALETKLGQWPNVEKELRLKAWRKSNDKYRPKPKKNEEFKAIEWTTESRENANNVLMLLHERNMEDSISKAELLRELGRFELSLQMLDIIDEYGLDQDGSYQVSLDRIRELAGQENSDLAVVEPDINHGLSQDADLLSEPTTKKGKVNPPEAIEELLTYLPFFREHGLEELVTHHKAEKQKDGSIHVGYYTYHSRILEFFELLYKHDMQITDYVGKVQWKQLKKKQWIQQADIYELRLALTFLARSEYWVDGSWKEAIEEGLFVKLLEQLKNMRKDAY